MKPGIEVTVRTGQYGDQVHRFALDLEPDIYRDLTEPLELSDNAFALSLKSIGRHSAESYATTRRRKLVMRQEMADRIARQIAAKLVEHFGDKDQTDGYSKEEMRRIYSRA